MPTPPDWAREATPLKPGAKPSAPVPVQKPEPAPVLSLEMRSLVARQEARWAQTLAQLSHAHQQAMSRLDDHHRQRMAGLTTDIDKRLAALNGLASRAGALIDREKRDREIAYPVAKRQRLPAEEKARQEAAKEDLRRAQLREIETARAKHDRLSATQRKVLEFRERRAAEKSERPVKPVSRTDRRDYER